MYFLSQRAHSGVKPPPKPKLPSSRPAPPRIHKPVVSTTDKQEDEPVSVCNWGKAYTCELY